MKRLLYLLTFIFAVYFCAASNPADSLKALLEKSGDDTSKVKVLIALGRASLNTDPQQTILYGKMARELSERLNYHKGVALAYKTIATGYFNKTSYIEALHNNELALHIFDSIGDKVGVANMYSNMGNVYYQKGSEEKALELYLKSLKISEEVKDTLRILTALSNIGATYINSKKKANYDKALQYFMRAYPLSVKLDDNNSTGPILANIGELYIEKYDPAKAGTKAYFDSALVYYEKSLAVSEGTDNEPYTLNDMGTAFAKIKNFDKAISYHQKAYEKAKALDLKYDMAGSLTGVAQAYEEKGDYNAALKNFKDAEVLAKESDATGYLKDVYYGLTDTYSNLNDLRNAFKYQNLLIAIKDTIYNIDTDKKLGSLQFDYELDKKEGEINLLEKDQQLKEKEISKQKIVRNSFIGGFAIVLLFAGVFFKQRNRISKEKKRSDELLLNILPAETAEELKATGKAKTKSFDLATVLFTDFKNFTQASEKLTPEELVEEINHCYSEFDKIVHKYGIEKIKTIGDSYMCAGGIPVANSTHATDVVKAGLEMQQFIADNKKIRMDKGMPFFELRCGIHTGPVVAGIVGIKKFAYDIWGDTVNTASRMESSGQIGKVNISGTTYEKIKDHFTCTHRGKIEAKNKGMIDMYFVDGLRGA